MNIDIEKIIRDYLPQVVHMSLATSKDNKPWVCEVHFAYDADLNLYFRSLVSRRHSQEIAENASVAGSIVRQYTLDEYPLGVYFEGIAEMLQAGDEQNKAFECIKARMSVSNDVLEEAKREDGHRFYKVSVDNWYVFGKLNTEQGQKYKLAWNGGKK